MRWLRRRRGISWGGSIGWGKAGLMHRGTSSQVGVGVPALSDVVFSMCRQQGAVALSELVGLGGLHSKRGRGGACVLCGVRA